MKPIIRTTVCLALSGLTLSSCIGSYACFNKVRSWNQEATGNKFLDELIFLCLWIVPVYEVTLFADTLVLNTIEFWQGSNPLEAGITKEVQGKDGKYLITTTKDGYSIQKEGNDEAIELEFNQQMQSWNVISDGKCYEIMKMKDDGTVDLNLQNGNYLNVSPDAQGVQTARESLLGSTYYAVR